MTDLVADAYATIPTFRTFIRNAGTSDATDPDSALELLALEAAARAIDRACGRKFDAAAATATARVFTAARSPLWRYVVDIDDLADPATITSVKFDATGDGDYTTTTTAYRVGPANAVARGLPYTRIIFDAGTYATLVEEGVQVTAKWGWTAIPTTIQNANLIQAARFLKRRDSPFGVAGSPEMGNELRLLAKLDPDVALMIAAFKRNWGAV